MKKGDVVCKDITVNAGDSLAHNFPTRELAEAWIKHENATGEVKLDDLNAGRFMVVALHDYIISEEHQVQWVVGDEFAIKSDDGGFKIIDTKEDTNWKVIRESTPTYQSSVAQMTDDELRGSIDALRRTRIVPVKVSRTKVKKEPVDNSPMAKALSGMSPEKKLELMKKLGMVE